MHATPKSRRHQARLAYVALTPGHGTLVIVPGDGCCARLVGLALDAQVHDVISADGTVVHLDVP